MLLNIGFQKYGYNFENYTYILIWFLKGLREKYWV